MWCPEPASTANNVPLWANSKHKLMEDNTQRPNVRGGRGLVTELQLRRHVTSSPRRCSRYRRRIVSNGNAEVRNHQPAICGAQNVLWLDVTMNDATAVNRRNALHQTARVGESVLK
jgi:hypothetical protein